MIKLLIVHDLEYKRRGSLVRWAYARRSHALKKYAPADFQVDRICSSKALSEHDVVNRYDVIFSIDYSIVPVLRRKYPTTTIVSSFNRDSNMRWELWDITCQNSDYVICNNPDAFRAGNYRERTCCISNGVDVDLFRKTSSVSDREFDVVWVGSTAERKCKNYHNVIEPLSREFNVSFRPVLDAHDASILPESELVDWYNSGKVVVCASHSEGGGPSYLMEAMACGCIPVTTWIGSVPEFHKSSQHPICNTTTEAFIRGIKLALSKPHLSDLAVSAMQQNKYGGPDGREGHFYELFRELHAGRTPAPFHYLEGMGI